MPNVGDPFNPRGLFSSVWIPPAIFHNQELSPTSKLCYGRLAYHCGERNYCWPSQDTLAKDLGIAPRTVRDCLSQLESLGYIKTEQLGLSKTNRYHLQWFTALDDCLRNPDRQKTATQESKASVNVPETAVQERQETAGPIRKNNSIEQFQKDTTSIVSFEDLADELSRMRNTAKGGSRIKSEEERETLLRWLHQECPSRVDEAFALFLDDPFWQGQKKYLGKERFPISGFIKQFSRYSSKLPHSTNGNGRSGHPEAVDLPAVSLEPMAQPALPELPYACQEWNRVVTAGEPVTEWGPRRDKSSSKAMQDPDFIAAMPKVFERCQAARQGNEEMTRHVNFRWLFKDNKEKEAENWYDVANGSLAWATAKKSAGGHGKSAGALAVEQYLAELGGE
jgi:hypothetical protein